MVRCWGLFYFVVIVLSAVSCSENEKSRKIVLFHIHNSYNMKVYLQTIAGLNESERNIDSAIVKNGNDSIYFTVPDSVEKTYRIKLANTPLEVFFINDANEVYIEADILKPLEYQVKFSPATNALQSFFKGQQVIADSSRKIVMLIDSLKSAGISKIRISSLVAEVDSMQINYFQRYKYFCDTISSPAAFLYVYNNVDFGRDYAGLKEFVLSAANRFPHYRQIQQLKTETLEYLNVFEDEFYVGDKLPELKLPDKMGKMFSTYSLKGKYVFMDFWSTWCNVCLQYDKIKENIRKKFPLSKFEMVSVAIDSEKESWDSYQRFKKYDWPQLIDEKMWKGETIRQYRIDSIPFNFFLDPDGRILAKAIPPDSVLPVITKFIK